MKQLLETPFIPINCESSFITEGCVIGRVMIVKEGKKLIICSAVVMVFMLLLLVKQGGFKPMSLCTTL